MKAATLITMFLSGGWAALLCVDFLLFCEVENGAIQVARVRNSVRSFRYGVMAASILSLGVGFVL